MNLKKETCLITGGGGVLGSYMGFGLKPDRSILDIAKLESVLDFFANHRPEVVFHLAAATDLVVCEKNLSLAYQVNAVGTYNIALAAREHGARVIYVSTSAVFDGRKPEPYEEGDVPNPQTHYGHSKYLGELAACGMDATSIIARTCWVFGGGPEKDRKFVANIVRQLHKPRIEVISGKRGSPTYAADLAKTLLMLADRDGGVYHVGNDGSPTRVEIAREIVRIMGASTEVVETDPEHFESQYPGAGARGNESIRSKKLPPLRPWQDALKEYLLSEWSDFR